VPFGCALAFYPRSYRYDNEHNPKLLLPTSALVADMPGNHRKDGFNVLYWDGHVKFCDSPFCSSDPKDNIFAPQPGWGADSDSFIRQ
jgi:prepilin-type processing-associated H-X9-DG protein